MYEYCDCFCQDSRCNTYKESKFKNVDDVSRSKSLYRYPKYINSTDNTKIYFWKNSMVKTI